MLDQTHLTDDVIINEGLLFVVIAAGPGLHGDLHFARQFRCFIRQLLISNDNENAKNWKRRYLCSLVLKISNLSLNTNLGKIVTSDIFQRQNEEIYIYKFVDFNKFSDIFKIFTEKKLITQV